MDEVFVAEGVVAVLRTVRRGDSDLCVARVRERRFGRRRRGERVGMKVRANAF